MSSSSRNSPLAIDLVQIVEGRIDSKTLEIFNAFLHANEALQSPELIFKSSAHYDVYLIEKPLETVSNLDRYKNSYVLTINQETEVHICTLKYVNAKNKIQNVILTEVEKNKLMDNFQVLSDCNIMIGNKSIINYLRTFEQDEVDETQIQHANKVYAAKIASENLTQLISKKSVIIGSKIFYSFMYNGINYQLEFKHNLLRRYSTKSNCFYYEIYHEDPFYIGIASAKNLYYSLGTIKLASIVSILFSVSQKQKRVIKFFDEPTANLTKEQYAQMLHFYENVLEVISKDERIPLRFKRIEVIEEEGGFKVIHIMSLLLGQDLPHFTYPTLKDPTTNIVKKLIDRADVMEKALESLYITIHQREWLHNDIKPENFIIYYDEDTDKLAVQIIDFDEIIYPGGQMRPIGSVAYLAPEAKNNKEFSQASDMYSMGLVLLGIYLKTTVNNANLEESLAKVSIPLARNFFKKLVAVNPDKRGNVYDALTYLISNKYLFSEKHPRLPTLRLTASLSARNTLTSLQPKSTLLSQGIFGRSKSARHYAEERQSSPSNSPEEKKWMRFRLGAAPKALPETIESIPILFKKR